MKFKAIPFKAKITRTDPSIRVAKQLQSIIDENIANGWEYMRMENVATSIAPTKGCFGLGAQAGFTTSFQILVFKRHQP